MGWLKFRYERAGPWWMAGLLLLYIVLLLGRHMPPAFADYSDWIYEGILLRNHLLGVPDAAHVLKHYPVPNIAATAGIGLLGLVFPWQLASRLWLCLLLGICFAACRHMLRTCRAQAALWVIAPAAIFLNVNLWYGFVNFELGLGLTILLSSLLLREEKRDWIIGSLLVLIFFCHMIPFAFAALVVVSYAVQSGRGRLLWQLTPGVLLSLWYVYGRFVVEADADARSGMFSTVRTYSAAFWAFKGNSYLKFYGFINPVTLQGSEAVPILGPACFLLLQAANLVLCSAMGWLLVRAAVFAYRERSKERFLWAAAALAMPVYLFSPGAMLGISDPGARVLQTLLAVVMFLVAATTAADRRLMRAGAACAVALQVAGVVLLVRVAFLPEQKTATIPHIPQRIIMFAHVPNHVEDFFGRALEQGNMDLPIFPTGMFLNTRETKAAPTPSRR